MRKAIALFKGDLRNISRDSVFILSCMGPLILAVVVRFSFPYLSQLLMDFLSIDLYAYKTIIMSFILLLTPALFGMLAGLFILDEKDQNLITFIGVTPLGRKGYILYRTLMPFIVCIIFSLVVLGATQLVPIHLYTIPVILMVALQAPMIALLLGVFASNKVEGLAAAKGVGVILMAPIIAYLLSPPWDLLFLILPAYWVSLSFVSGYEGSLLAYTLYTCLGLAYHILLLGLLLRLFNRRVR